MSKRLFAVLLTLVMLIGVLPMAAMAESYTPDCTCGYCGATCDIKRVDEKDVTCTTDESWIEVCEKHECETERTGEEAPGHKICDEPEVSTVYEATCTKGGKIAYKYSCTVCGDMINIQYEYTPVKDHTYVDGKCECGAKEPCKHEAGDIVDQVITEATCCKDGSIVETCKCGEVFTTVLPAAGEHDTTNPECKNYIEPCKHEAGDIVKQECTATCCKAGELIETCKCGEVFKTAYPAMGEHDTTNPECEKYVAPCKHEAGDIVDQVITYATCRKDGSIVETCKCGEVFTTVLNKTGHDWEEATCSSPKTCKNCGKTFGRPLYRHDWAKATCKDPMTCKDCGKTFGRPLHHSWKKATCESPKTCRHCGKTVGRALKHDWAEATCKSPKTCKDCGKTVGTAHKAVDHNRNGRCDKCNIRINNFFHKYHSNKHFFNKFWKNHK